MYNNVGSDLNTKYKFTYELLACGVNGSPGVVGRGINSSGPCGV
jgi:hypothetical protein